MGIRRFSLQTLIQHGFADGEVIQILPCAFGIQTDQLMHVVVEEAADARAL